MTAAPIARVLVDSPLPQLDRLLDYRIPPSITGVVPGVRVTVPLRSVGRMIAGYVIETADAHDFPGPISDIDSLVSPVPVLRPEVWAIARAVATRAAGSANDVLRQAIPTRQVRVEKAWLAAGGFAPAPSAADTAPDPAPGIDLTGYAPGTIAALLAPRGRAALSVVPGVTESPTGIWIGRWATTIAEAGAAAFRGGGSAIIALPDYRDVDQVLAALEGLVPAEAIIRWDARQPNPARYRGLLRAADAPAVVVGTRSAVLAPATRLDLLVVWDDGDPLHLEPLAPYAHSRDVALLRQEQQGSALLFAGHSRTAEVQRLVEVGWLSEIAPARRARPRVIPTASLTSGDGPADRARIPTTAWRAARDALETGPVLIQVARPGFSPGLACAECGQAARCRHCAGPLSTSAARSVPACGWCGRPDPQWACVNCGSTRLRGRGRGSVRTADELGRAFPGVRVRVADGEHPIREVSDEPALIVATRGAEPVASGGYRAVLLLDGDRMVARESLRVGEDCLRWWASAIALAADDATTMLVGVGGPVASALTTWRLADYARTELADRRNLRFPPAVRVATVTGEPDAVATATAAARRDGVDVWGPTATPDGARAILLFDYALGAQIATTLRAEVVRSSSRRRAPKAGAARSRGRQQVALRVRMDDPAPFDE